jgi:hypothetical protein
MIKTEAALRRTALKLDSKPKQNDFISIKKSTINDIFDDI